MCMYSCMCVSVSTCVNVCMYICVCGMYTCMYICESVHLCVYVYIVCIYMCILWVHVFVCMYTYVCVHVCICDIYTYIRIYVYICVYVCMHVCVFGKFIWKNLEELFSHMFFWNVPFYSSAPFFLSSFLPPSLPTSSSLSPSLTLFLQFSLLETELRVSQTLAKKSFTVTLPRRLHFHLCWSPWWWISCSLYMCLIALLG